ncbi:MAG: DUF3575 domain-containing protein [Bacteroidales bacterium]
MKNYSKLIVLALAFIFPTSVFAQTSEVQLPNSKPSKVSEFGELNLLNQENARDNDVNVLEFTKAVKLNAAILVGIINPSIELKVSDKWTVNFDMLGCFKPHGFCKNDKPITIAATWLEARWYPKEAFHGFFAGANIGWSVYRMTKGLSLIHWGDYSEQYQLGSNVMIGATIGYQYAINNHWGVEASWGGGWQRSAYEGHSRSDGSMYVGWNHSGEWLPAYKAALNIVFKW